MASASGLSHSRTLCLRADDATSEDLMSRRYEEPGVARNLLIAENTPDGVAEHECVLDDQGRPVDYVFVYTNAAFGGLTGLRREDIHRKAGHRDPS